MPLARLPLLLPRFPTERLEQLRALGRDPRRAGSHQLSIWGIANIRGQNSSTAVHEDVHDRLLNETSYGFCQRYWAAYSTAREASWRVAGEGWTQLLVDRATQAHEAAATYLSAKLHRRGDEVAALIPDDEYISSYRLLGQRVDSIAHSSFLQYLIADAIIAVAFDSPLLSRLREEAAPATPRMLDDEAPDERLLTVLTVLEQGEDLASRIEQAVRAGVSDASIRRPDFDVHDDEAWCRLPGGVRQTLNALISDVIDEWLQSHSYGGVEVSTHDGISNAADDLLAIAAERGVTYLHVNEEFARLYWPGADGHFGRFVMSSASSIVFNAPSPLVTSPPKVPAGRVLRVPWSGTDTALIHRFEIAAFDTPMEWWLWTRPSDAAKNGFAWGISAGELDHILARRDAVASAGKLLQPVLYVIGLPEPSPDVATLDTQVAALRMLLTRPCYTHAGDHTVFYMHGNLLLWVTLLSAIPDLTYTNLFFRDDDDDTIFDDLSDPAGFRMQGSGMGAHIFHGGSLWGTFVRFQHARPFVLSSRVITNYAKRYRTLTCSDDEVTPLTDRVGLALTAVEAAWCVF